MFRRTAVGFGFFLGKYWARGFSFAFVGGFVYCSNRFPGGGVTFFAAAKKVTKESRLSDPKHLLGRPWHSIRDLAQQ
ncbi:hypothetical protein [Candidatus Burkholderia verschuerenii]|uniref:hypothetical protein n=1 Tax=Candidatus Burkholderia verschuerenii TaxID=242163 RepID=UPI0012EEB377|nr:hypothetical protein [Candidatus Burkholderia verschuerenii]